MCSLFFLLQWSIQLLGILLRRRYLGGIGRLCHRPASIHVLSSLIEHSQPFPKGDHHKAPWSHCTQKRPGSLGEA